MKVIKIGVSVFHVFDHWKKPVVFDNWKKPVVFDKWKKPEKLQKHTNSETHITSMTKWALFKASQLRNRPILAMLD